MDGKTDPDDIPEPPKNPVTRTGNLWVLGKHRIICGDSCDQQTVERLLDGAAPDLMVTDPPYGVGYDSSWRYKAGISTKGGAFGKSANDDQNDWEAAYALFSGQIAYGGCSRFKSSWRNGEKKRCHVNETGSFLSVTLPRRSRPEGRYETNLAFRASDCVMCRVFNYSCSRPRFSGRVHCSNRRPGRSGY